ncbi:hypothetical protein LJC29_04270 [Bacteroides sp. OttesenSCG-928-N06]|nr:hypothetical protein [Bacteroides sp. OttesenSCG-928-N06]
MKKLFILPLLALLMVGCDDNGEKKAAQRLETARQALNAGDFGKAKIELDSIKVLYPKAFNARKERIGLMQEIELSEQMRTVSYLDSMLQVKQQAFEDIKNRFVLEKDAEYQDVGNYFWPTQTVEKNLHRSYLRFQVNEHGVMTMTSIYCGSRSIHHTAVKVTAPDGTFAQTPASNDSYETTDMGEKIEKADFHLGQDGNVIGFIYLNKDKNIRVDYIGDGKYNTTMNATDRKAAAELYGLSQILSSIEQIKAEKKEANLKIEFVKRNMEKSRNADTTEGNTEE